MTKPNYTSEDVIACIDAVSTVGGSFQTVLTSIISESHTPEILTACQQLEDSADGDSKQLNGQLSVLRVQIARACETLDLPKYTVKKVDGKWAFVAAGKAANRTDPFKSAVAKFISQGPTDEDKAMVMRLMTSIMANK